MWSVHPLNTLYPRLLLVLPFLLLSHYPVHFLVICDTPSLPLCLQESSLSVLDVSLKTRKPPLTSVVLTASSFRPERRSHYLPKWWKCRPSRQEQ